jgi:hypothetical protein
MIRATSHTLHRTNIEIIPVYDIGFGNIIPCRNVVLLAHVRFEAPVFGHSMIWFRTKLAREHFDKARRIVCWPVIFGILGYF